MTEDMFGGLHRNDEMKRAEQSGWSRKKTKSADRNKGLAAEALLRSLDGCHWVSRNSPQSALDTADFVRHVPPTHMSAWSSSVPSGPRRQTSFSGFRRRCVSSQVRRPYFLRTFQAISECGCKRISLTLRVLQCCNAGVGPSPARLRVQLVSPPDWRCRSRLQSVRRCSCSGSELSPSGCSCG